MWLLIKKSLQKYKQRNFMYMKDFLYQIEISLFKM